MGWLDKLTGRKKVTAKPDPHLKALQVYCIQLRASAMILAHTEHVETTLAGMNISESELETRRTVLLAGMNPHQRFFQPDLIALINVGIELGLQVSVFKKVPPEFGVSVIVPYVCNQCLFFPSDVSAQIETALGAYTETKRQLIAENTQPSEIREGLHPIAVRMAAGIMVGNAVALDFLSQIYRGVSEPAPSAVTTEVFAREVLTRDRTLADDEQRHLPPMTYISTVALWLNTGSDIEKGHTVV